MKTRVLTAFLVVVGTSAVPGENPSYLDDGVSGVILGDQSSGAAFMRQIGIAPKKAGAGLRVLASLNQSRSEVLELHAHPGGRETEFLEFEVRLAKRGDLESLRTTTHPRFESSRGMHLGLRAQVVEQILGAPHQKQVRGEVTTMVYRCASGSECPALKRVNMPQYEAQYTFRKGELVAIRAGYPIP